MYDVCVYNTFDCKVIYTVVLWLSEHNPHVSLAL